MDNCFKVYVQILYIFGLFFKKKPYANTSPYTYSIIQISDGDFSLKILISKILVTIFFVL